MIFLLARPTHDRAKTLGKHTLTFGGSFSYTQLNARDERTNTGMIGFTNFENFLTGSPITYTADGFIATTFLQGDANRYYRSNETGMSSYTALYVCPTLSGLGITNKTIGSPRRSRCHCGLLFETLRRDLSGETETGCRRINNGLADG